MKTTLHSILLLTVLSYAAGWLAGCANLDSKVRHRPAKVGERVGQISVVEGDVVTINIDEPCRLHEGDLLVIKRIYCEPGTKKKDIKDCKLYPSGHVEVKEIIANDHLAKGKVTDGTAVVDAPVFMDDENHEDPLYEH